MPHKLLDQLEHDGRLAHADYIHLLQSRSPELAEELYARARRIRDRVYGPTVFLRGLVELTNYCRNDCYYCGIRRSNCHAERYRLQPEQVFASCKVGHDLGFRTFVLQGGEDEYFHDDRVVELIHGIKSRFPDSAVTLSLGEKSYDSYRRLREAGADRYLLRHETADPSLYQRLHPAKLTLANRLQCLRDLRSLGFQTGAGFMVGTPGQTFESLALDLDFLAGFRPEMIGIGPFMPHHDTPFAKEPAGSMELTLFLLGILRLMLPEVLLPATTALGSIHPQGRELGVLAGANVIMPNLSPPEVRHKYLLYDNKLSSGAEAAEGLRELRRRLATINCTIDPGRGDHAQHETKITAPAPTNS